LLDLQKQGQTIVIVSHDIDFILDFVPRVLVMDQGTIVADGSPLEIFCRPKLLEKADLAKPILLDLCLAVQQSCPSFLTSVQEEEILADLLQRMLQANRRTS
jgi:ABC-type sulfate/molybdate transport systems ATPase subunit